MKKLINTLAGNPLIFNVLRRLIEFNYFSVKKVIRTELTLTAHPPEAGVARRILDLPCGTGEFCTLFPTAAYRGMDISDTYIAYARRKYPGHRFLAGDARDSGFGDHEFDQVLMLGFLHHLDDATVPPVLQEVKRILKPGGTFLLIEDTPITSPWNVLGRVLMKFDVGSYIRPAADYRAVLEKDFVVERNFDVQSGLWRYSVFVMAPRQP